MAASTPAQWALAHEVRIELTQALVGIVREGQRQTAANFAGDRP